MVQNPREVIAVPAVATHGRLTARNCHGNPFKHNDLRAVRIRGVCPRGLIEARLTSNGAGMAGSIRGVCPRGLIEA